MDIVYLHGLTVDCVVGIWDWERAITQKVTIDLDMGKDISKAARSRDIEDTLNYKAVSKHVVDLVIQGEFELVETMAEEIAAALNRDFDVQWCRVRINKTGAVRGARDVGVVIERGSRQT